jgi:hypothetical protein
MMTSNLAIIFEKVSAKRQAESFLLNVTIICYLKMLKSINAQGKGPVNVYRPLKIPSRKTVPLEKGSESVK